MGIKIYLIRHGQASFGSEDYDRLSGLGQRQSELLGGFFHETGLNFDAVYTGVMKRQVETARITLSHMPGCEAKPVVDSSFDEYDAAAIIKAHLPRMLHEDPTYQDDVNRLFTDPVSFRRVFDTAMSRWFQGMEDHPHIETWDQVRARVAGAISSIASANTGAAVVGVFTSGGAIAATLQSALGLSNDQARKVILRTANSSVSLFEQDEAGVTLISYNNVCHLQLTNEKGLITYY
jgi:broad specificity phosphatase PhoE